MFTFSSLSPKSRSILDKQDMKAVESHTINQLKMSGKSLMDKAGRAASQFILQRYALKPGDKVWIVCGGGNNGGDGMITTRYLAEAGINIGLSLITDPEKLHHEALDAWKQIRELNIRTIYTLPSEAEIHGCCMVVDALLGLGFEGNIKEPYASAIQQINQWRLPICSLDLPSGLHASECRRPNLAVQADSTVSFGWLKTCLALQPSASLAGHVHTADIGFPQEALEFVNPKRDLLTKSSFSPNLMKRDPSSHKGDYGHCLIIGGSDGMYGAPILSGEAAIRCGAGMVTIMVPSNHSGFFPNYSPELMVQTLKSCGSYLSPPALDTIKTYIAQRRVNALIVGMGLSKREESLSLVAAILENIDLPIVLDADGLSVLKKKNLSIKTKQLIVTPHPKECEQSLGLTIENYVSHPFSSLESLAKDHQCTIVYKTASTTISHPSGESFVNSTGNAGMATAGMGDVLSGMIGSLLAQKLSPRDAAHLGVYLHGLAGDFGANRLGMPSLTASKLLDFLPDAFADLEIL